MTRLLLDESLVQNTRLGDLTLISRIRRRFLSNFFVGGEEMAIVYEGTSPRMNTWVQSWYIKRVV